MKIARMMKSLLMRVRWSIWICSWLLPDVVIDGKMYIILSVSMLNVRRPLIMGAENKDENE